MRHFDINIMVAAMDIFPRKYFFLYISAIYAPCLEKMRKIGDSLKTL